MCYFMNVKEGNAKLPGKVNDVVTVGKLLTCKRPDQRKKSPPTFH